jgi:uncharacterized peroxidase-related enzyme
MAIRVRTDTVTADFGDNEVVIGMNRDANTNPREVDHPTGETAMSTQTYESVLPVASYADASPEAQRMFDQIKASMGRVPKLFAAQSYSPRALRAKLALDGELGKGVFSGLPKEVIALAVAQVNGCDYCLAAHTAISKMRGVPDAEILNFRRGTSADEKLAALAALAHEITESRGHPSWQTVERFFAVGYDRAALVELIGLVAANVWNNYAYHIAQPPMDFPPAPELT